MQNSMEKDQRGVEMQPKIAGFWPPFKCGCLEQVQIYLPSDTMTECEPRQHLKPFF